MRFGLGGVRLTPFGTGVLLVVLAVAGQPPAAVDPELASLVWLALLGILLVGCFWPVLALRSVRATVRAPRDAVVGDEVPLAIELAGRLARLEVRALDPPGP
ncbi:MAG: hypothetical protein JWN46_1168, partial [Acidimicrobiales bacterium]|nr:hypothetical protein [Acidimicrobiales bacterium]